VFFDFFKIVPGFFSIVFTPFLVLLFIAYLLFLDLLGVFCYYYYYYLALLDKKFFILFILFFILSIIFLFKVFGLR
jgi:hypothetical protein